MWWLVEIIRETKPKMILWENVPGCLAADMRRNYKKFITALNTVGYHTYAKILNAKDFGVPQHRDRVFVLAIRKDIEINFEMPRGYDSGIRIRDILESDVSESYTINNDTVRKMLKSTFHQTQRKIHNINKHCFTICARTDPPYVRITAGKVRKFTAKECFRLMGFSDDDFYKCKGAGVSDAQLYKQAGNSIVVNVLMAIFGELYGVEWQHQVYGNFYKTEQQRINELPLLQAA